MPDSAAAERRRTYIKKHQRLRYHRGSAGDGHVCVDCGDPAQDWSQIHGTDGTDPLAHFEPRCKRCHGRYDLPQHPYVQVADQLRAGIASGEVGPLLPSIMELTEQTGLAVGTIRRAIGVLVDEGIAYIAYTVPGRGTFVRGTPDAG